MTSIRKTIAASLAALTIGGAVVTTSTTPAAAWGYGYGWGWGGPAIAAGVLGGIALGTVAAAASTPYYGGCVATQPFYDSWGYVHYRRVRVPC